MNEKDIALRNEINRYNLLLELYKAANGMPFIEVNIKKIADSLNFSEMDYYAAHWYFGSENLFAMNGDNIVSLSHKAIVEIENSIKNPNQSTEYFSSTVIQNFHAPVGSVQTGNYNVANVNQNIGQSFSEILEQLAILKREFQSQNFEEKEDAIEIVCDLENEIVKENPNKTKIKSFLKTTKDFAVKTGTELAASTIAKLIESQIGIKG